MSKPELTRRAFLGGSRPSARPVIRPPGLETVSAPACKGCNACEAVCPTGIVSLSAGTPALDFRAGECTFCGACAASCPKGLFAQAPVSRLSHVATIEAHCLALNFVDCQSCRDACPTAAIRFQPRRGGPFVPVLVAEACTGCGACLSVCPADAVAMKFPDLEADLEAAHA